MAVGLIVARGGRCLRRRLVCVGPGSLGAGSEAAGRVRPEIGEAQIPLPLQGD